MKLIKKTAWLKEEKLNIKIKINPYKNIFKKKDWIINDVSFFG